MKAVKVKIIKGDVKVIWKCPECKTLNIDWVYDDLQEEVLQCYGCGGHFKGEFNVNL